MATLKSHNSGTVKDTCKIAPNWGLSGSGNQTVLFKFLLDHHCCHGNKLTSFRHKIDHYSASIRDITKILAPSRGFWGPSI